MNIFDLSKVGRIKQETDNCLLSPAAVIQADRALITLTQLRPKYPGNTKWKQEQQGLWLVKCMSKLFDPIVLILNHKNVTWDLIRL